MAYYIAGLPYSAELYHFGILGQKWGIRRYQNPDGTRTQEGKERYRRDLNKMAAKDAQRVSDANAAYGTGAGTRRKLLSKEIDEKMKNRDYKEAYDRASKNVNVEKSLKRAESLHRHSGTFERGQWLADSGKSTAKIILKSVGTAAVAAAGGYASGYLNNKSGGDRNVSTILALIGGASAAITLGKGARDAYQVNYYERNKKF